MARYPLASNSNWELTNDDQDIRGWEARDADNNYLGEVTHMLMNTETEMVDVICLDTGREFETADVHIGKDIVYCEVDDAGKPPGLVKVLDAFGRIARRMVADDPAFIGQEADYRSHYGKTLATYGWVYEFYQPGYRYGYTLASRGANAARTYEQVEPVAMKDFISRHGGAEYSTHREAIRYGYEHQREQLRDGAV